MYGVIFHTGVSALPLIEDDEMAIRMSLFDTIEEAVEHASHSILYGKVFMMILDFENKQIITSYN